MRIGVLGTGPVGHALATRLVEAGHEVTMGSRDLDNPKARHWAAGAGDGAHAGDFAAAAAGAEVVVNATAGSGSLAALAAAGDLAGKVIVDVSNALDNSGGTPILSVPQGDSLAEQIQRAHPDARVVKTLNTMNADVMAHPELLAGEHDVFVAGDDTGARDTAIALLGDLGWPATAVVDLGGLRAARGLESYVLFWIAVRMATGHNRFNIKVVGR